MNHVGVGVGVMMVNENQVLMGLRHGDPHKAGSELHGENTWTLPGGKVEFGEELEAACRREVQEETGCSINASSLELISVANDKVTDAHFITLGFLCSIFEGEPRVMEPDEIIEWRWWPLDRLPDRIFFPSERVIKNYLDNKIYQRFDNEQRNA